MTGIDRFGAALFAAALALTCAAPALTLEAPVSSGPARPGQSSLAKSPWSNVIAEADALGLPTKFLKSIPPDFITVEFEDLHTFAAEYHPAEHRMLLNLALSFNGAGGTLKPLVRMTHRDVATLFHEFFHAYMDYVTAQGSGGAADPEMAALRAFARDRQSCRYQAVMITPVAQRKAATEIRFLSEGEAWEALNETWAVFVGWAVWTKLELPGERGKRSLSASPAWRSRLKQADRVGDLVGYYEPEDAEERRITQKRYLAPINAITPREVKELLKIAFGETETAAKQVTAAMNQARPGLKEVPPCRD